MSNQSRGDINDILEVPNFDYEGGSSKKRKKSKKKRKNRRNSKFYKFTRVLALIYLVGLVAFESVLVVMDVLPASTLIALIVVLSLLSIVLFIQLFFKNIKMWAKVFATLLSVVLLSVYGLGSAYALGTLSFLDTIGTNTKNENSVNVTREPFNIIITGMDVDGTVDSEGRSDVNMVVTINPQSGEILMTSIPRDYAVRMVKKGNQIDKITHTGFYGVDDTIAAIEDLLDIKANYYVKVNFDTVVKFVDAIGGVDVYSEYEFVPVKFDTWTVKKGMNHMTGEQALAFARERKAFKEGDNQRIKNQQAVFQAMIKKALSSKTLLLSYTKILSALSDYIEMNMSSQEMRALVKLQIAKNIDWEIEKYTLEGHDSSSETYSTGSQKVYVMAQDEDSIAKAKANIQRVLNAEK